MIIFSLIFIIIVNSLTPLSVGTKRLFILIASLSLITFNYSGFSILNTLDLFHGYLSLDSFRSSFILLLLFIFFIVNLNYLTYSTSLLIILSLIGSCFLIYSNNLLIIILSLELQSFTSYLLAYLSNWQNKNKFEHQIQAGLKYLLLGALASSLIIIGISIIYFSIGVLDYNTIILLCNWDQNWLGLSILLVGCLFKLGIAPFHQWTPDIYGWVNNETISYLSLAPKLGVICFISLFISNLIPNYLILIFVNLTLIVGSLGGLVQNEYRRLLAYSSISHIGYLLLGIFLSKSSLLIYIFQYSITTLTVLFWFIYLYNNLSDRLAVLLKAKSDSIIICVLFSLLIFSFAGIPPLIGFYAKLEIFYSLIIEKAWLTILITISTSLLTTFYYLKLIIMILSSPYYDYKSSKLINYFEISLQYPYVIVSLTLIILITSLDYDLLQQTALVISWF